MWPGNQHPASYNSYFRVPSGCQASPFLRPRPHQWATPKFSRTASHKNGDFQPLQLEKKNAVHSKYPGCSYPILSQWWCHHIGCWNQNNPPTCLTGWSPQKFTIIPEHRSRREVATSFTRMKSITSHNITDPLYHYIVPWILSRSPINHDLQFKATIDFLPNLPDSPASWSSSFASTLALERPDLPLPSP